MKIMGNYETERLKELIRLAKLNKVVKTQDEFARLIGAKDGTAISHALKCDGKYKADTLIAKAELALMKAGIAIDSPDTISPTNPTDAASTIQSMGINKDTDAESTKNALPGSVAELQSIIRQQQEQINRLNREIDGLYERIDELKGASSIAAPRSVRVG